MKTLVQISEIEQRLSEHDTDIYKKYKEDITVRYSKGYYHLDTPTGETLHSFYGIIDQDKVSQNALYYAVYIHLLGYYSKREDVYSESDLALSLQQVGYPTAKITSTVHGHTVTLPHQTIVIRQKDIGYQVTNHMYEGRIVIQDILREHTLDTLRKSMYTHLVTIPKQYVKQLSALCKLSEKLCMAKSITLPYSYLTEGGGVSLPTITNLSLKGDSYIQLYIKHESNQQSVILLGETLHGAEYELTVKPRHINAIYSYIVEDIKRSGKEIRSGNTE